MLFCIFGMLASFGIGNAVQVGNITDSIHTAAEIFAGRAISKASVDWVVGIVVALITGLTVIGGIKRLGSVTEKMIPIMSIIYIIACLAVIITHISDLGHVFGLIFQGAFNPSAVVGGVSGFTLKTCITWGVKRGVFSNEAGLGSAPIAHAASSEKNPVKQGMYGIFEVFMDTIVICTVTGITLLISGIDLQYGVKGSTALNTAALATVFGNEAASLIIAIGLSLFALSTILGWALYGSRCCEYLFGNRSIRAFQVIFVILVIVGATMELSLAWDIADTLNALMAIPNLIALVGLSGVVVKLTKEHFEKEKQEKINK